jgi:hypothetical protein
MILDVVLVGLGSFLLATWVFSSHRPRLRKKLIERYRLPVVYEWTLFLIVIVPGWDILTTNRTYIIPILIVVGVLALGDLAIRREIQASSGRQG